MNEPWHAIRAGTWNVEAIFCRLKFNVAEIYYDRAEDKKQGSKFAIKSLKRPMFAIFLLRSLLLNVSTSKKYVFLF